MNGDYFVFTYDLKALKGQTGSYDEDDSKLPEETKWSVCSCVERSRYVPPGKNKNNRPDASDHNSNEKRGENSVFNVNDELKKLFDKHGIDYSNNPELKETITSSDNEKFLKSLIFYFQSILRLRVVDDKEEKGSSENDFIQSPVDPFYDSRKVKNGALPDNGDANGAYNIARKGIIILDKLKHGETKIKNITKKEWQDFSQKEETVDMQTKKYKPEE